MKVQHKLGAVIVTASIAATALAALTLLGAGIASAQQGAGAADGAPSIGDVSYAIGHDLGRDIASGLELDAINADIDRLAKGFADGLAGAYPELSQREIDRTLVAFNRVVSERQNAERLRVDPVYRALSDENARKSALFLQRFDEKEGAKSLDGGIRYLVMDSGSGASPTRADSVVVTFRALLIDGLEIASGTNVPIEVSSVQEGFQRVLTSMKAGDRWYVAVPPEMAFGAVGRDPDIGPNEAIVVDVALVRVIPAGEASE